MENEKYPEFSKQNEEVVAANQVHQEFDVEEYERTSHRYKVAFFVSLAGSILLILLAIASLVYVFSSGKEFDTFNIIFCITDLVFEVLFIGGVVECYHRWKSYE